MVTTKRKALSSPETDTDNVDAMTRQPCKARIVECLSPTPLSEAISSDKVITSSEEEKVDEQSPLRSPSAAAETRVTRSTKKKKATEESARKFEKLVATRKGKCSAAVVDRKFKSSIINSDSANEDRSSVRSVQRGRNTKNSSFNNGDYDSYTWNFEGSFLFGCGCWR